MPKDETQTSETSPPQSEGGQLSQSSSAPPSLDEASVSDLIKRQVAALFAAQPKPEPTTSEPIDVQGKIDAAIAKALAERDKDDQVFILQQEFDKFKESLPKPPKKGWGTFLLGHSFPR